MFSPIPFALYHPNAVANKVSYTKKQVIASNGRFDNYYYAQASFFVEDYFAGAYYIYACFWIDAPR